MNLRRAFWFLSASLCCLSACANIWGFDDLRTAPDSGGVNVIAPGGAGGGPAGTGGITTAGGAGGVIGDGAGGQGGSGKLGTGGSGGASRPDAGVDASPDATDSGLGGHIGTGGTSGTGGVIGVGGTSGFGGRTGTGGVIGVGGTSGVGGRVGTGGMTGTGGARGVGGAIGTGGARGVGGAMGTGGAPACGPTTCATGCCAAGRCITPTTAQQCGTRGAACVACGGCQQCGASGVCELSPTSKWVVQCASAQLTVLPPTGLTWDPAGVAGDGTAPDPFCQLERPSGVIDTTTGVVTRNVLDSFSATWNQTVTPASNPMTAAELMSADAATWRVWVGDNEFNGRGALACEVHPPLPASALVNGQFTVANLKNCVSFSMTLICQP
jgi:hypothetical protein